MIIERTFRILSYAVVLCGFASLWISGVFGVFGTALFFAVLIVSILIEGSRWQISERVGTALTVLALPAFYVLWKGGFFEFTGPETELPGILARLILSLTAIKLLQKKGDRDWIFLYVMAFFQVLLAAGLSISALYLAVLIVFVTLMVATIIVLEVKRTNFAIAERSRHHKGPIGDRPHSKLYSKSLPAMALSLLILITFVATPLFFLLPRVGGAGVGSSLGGVATYSGFSDSVRLGGIGRIQQNDEVVMRVRVEDREKLRGPIRWRGVALDTFDNQTWKRSRAGSRESVTKNDRDLFVLDLADTRESLIIQTVYLEPIDTQALFAINRAVAVQSNYPVIFRDLHDSLTFPRSGERTSYRVLSDVNLPSERDLRRDRAPYPPSFQNYLQLPNGLDPRIGELASRLTETTENRFDAARSIEFHLQNDYGYTLEQRAGGDQPLADFLFNVREGHCEYFATAMVIMLRTQGIAARVVNGFQQGEYNETADVYTVRQREAHSWVEVYFPGQNTWVEFDPTPAAAQTFGTGTAGFYDRINKYLEALEMIWIQYFVAFDTQEQRSMLTSIRRSISEYNERTTPWIETVREVVSAWWSELRGDSGFASSIIAAAIGLSVIFVVTALYLIAKRITKWLGLRELWKRIFKTNDFLDQSPTVDFYLRMENALRKHGLVRKSSQTPLEFAYTLKIPEAVFVTEKYNLVRFGNSKISSNERMALEDAIERLESYDGAMITVKSA